MIARHVFQFEPASPLPSPPLLFSSHPPLSPLDNCAAADGIVLFFVGRLLVGASTGTLSVARSAIAAVTEPEQRVEAFSYLEISRFIGYAVSPGLAGIFQMIKVCLLLCLCLCLSLSGVSFLLISLPLISPLPPSPPPPPGPLWWIRVPSLRIPICAAHRARARLGADRALHASRQLWQEV